MKPETKRSLKRAFSALLCLALLVSYIPSGSLRTRAATGQELITTVADPATLTRPEIIYGDSTLNAGKITVGKSVSDEGITVGGQTKKGRISVVIHRYM